MVPCTDPSEWGENHVCVCVCVCVCAHFQSVPNHQCYSYSFCEHRHNAGKKNLALLSPMAGAVIN